MGNPSSVAIKHKRPLIAELVGPAGAGKTTLSQALRRQDEKIQVAADLELRKLEHLPIFVGYAPFLLPVFLRRCRPGRRFTWDEIKAMVYLRGWPHVLRQPATNSETTILVDHGPVFKLATLDAFGPERLKRQCFEKWWHTTFKQWASTLDLIIWLDAPDTILVERINARSQRHAVKGKSELEAYSFLARYRISYDQILAKLTADGGPALLQFDTSQASIDQIANALAVRLN
jgi:shikimate kinase